MKRVLVLALLTILASASIDRGSETARHTEINKENPKTKSVCSNVEVIKRGSLVRSEFPASWSLATKTLHHSSATESPRAEFGDEPIISWLRTVPHLGRDFTHYLSKPREFTATWVASPSTRLSPWVVLGTSLTIVAVLYAIYAAIKDRIERVDK